MQDFGYDTETAIRSGVMNGIKYEIEGYILSAQELILREESEQSASELMHALIVADFLRGIQSFDMPNLF